MCLQEMQLLRPTVFLSAIDFDVLSSPVTCMPQCFCHMCAGIALAGLFFFFSVLIFGISFVMFQSI